MLHTTRGNKSDPARATRHDGSEHTENLPFIQSKKASTTALCKELPGSRNCPDVNCSDLSDPARATRHDGSEHTENLPFIQSKKASTTALCKELPGSRNCPDVNC